MECCNRLFRCNQTEFYVSVLSKYTLSNEWTEIYVVTDQQNSNIPVYKDRREDGEGVY